jgi:pimeloyl-ACP methyl ester carboxylesterase
MKSLIDLGGGTQLKFADEGSGPTVVLLHGWPVTALHWRATLPAMHAVGMRTITVSSRGLGEGSVGPGDFAKTTLARELIGLLDTLKVDQFALLGHDWGATIGYLVAVDYSDRVWAFAVEEEVFPGVHAPIPSPGKEHYPDWHGPFNRAKGLAEAILPGREEVYYRAFLRASAGPAGIDPVVEAAYLEAYRGPEQLEATLNYYRTGPIDRAAIASRSARLLDMPTLGIGGEYGMGKAVAACLGQVARSVQPLLVKGAGHYPAEQEPGVVNETLVKFLESNR